MAAVAGLLAGAGGCTSEAEAPSSAARPSPTPQPQPRLIAFEGYLRPRLSFEATQLVALDAQTLERTAPPLQLGDSVTEPVVDPNERVVALGGYNFGKVILVDPAALEVESKVEILEPRKDGQIHLVDWPRPDRLLGYAQDWTAHSLLPGRAFVADPEPGGVVEWVDLRGSAMSATPTERGVAFLVAPVAKVGGARVVLMDMDGDVRSVALRRISAGYVDPGTPGESLLREPALVSLGDAVCVIGAFEPVARVDVRSGALSYHRVRGLMRARFPGSTHPATGTAGSLEVRRRAAFPIGGSRVLVTGDETAVVRGGLLHDFERVAQIVDPARWRVRHSFDGVSNVQPAGRTVFGRARAGGLVALGRGGDVLYRRGGGRRTWVVVGDRLFGAGSSGRRAVEHDLRTGRKVGRLGEIDPWPLHGFPWPLRGSPLDSVVL